MKIIGNYFLRANIAWDQNNLHQAFRLFMIGAKTNEAFCKSSLAYFYDNGLGVKANPKKACYWYLNALENDRDPIAAHNLGMLFHAANDIKTAEKYFILAVDLNNFDSLINLANIAKEKNELKKSKDYLEQLLKNDKKHVIPSVRQKAKRDLQWLNANSCGTTSPR